MDYRMIWKSITERVKKSKNYILVAVAAISLAATSAGIYAMENPKLTNADFIRLHVVANSDTYEDQVLKLQVRDVVLALMAQKMEAFGSGLALSGGSIPSGTVKQAASYIQSNFPQIQAAAEEVVRQNGRDYPIKVSLGPSRIPEKVYGNVIFPAGDYQALTINIGEADGGNWWCVLFPPLCLIDTSPEANQPGQDAAKIEIKFKTVEILEKMI